MKRTNLKVSYISPFENKTNYFTYIQRKSVENFSIIVKDIRSAIFSDWQIQRNNKCAILNWYEDRIFNNERYYQNFIIAAFFLIFLKLRVKNIIWFRHNFVPHKFNMRGEIPYNWILKILKMVSACVVTMRKCNGIDSYIIPHPIYPGYAHFQQQDRDIELLWFGQVRRSKDLIWLMNSLHESQKLLIAGQCLDEQLIAEIEDIIAARNLKINWRNEFIDDDVLNDLLSRTKFAVLSYGNESVIVSGSFFHAASLGANVLVRDSDFGRFAAKNYQFCSILDENSFISVQRIPLLPAEDVVEELKVKNGTSSQERGWEAVLLKLGLIETVGESL